MNKKIYLCLFFALLLSLSFVKAQDFGEKALNVLNSAGDICANYGFFLRYIIGTECDLTLAFLITLVLWIFLLMMFFDIVATYSPFSGGTSFIIALGLSVILANFGFMGRITEWFSEFIANGGALRVIIFFIAILIIYVIIKSITKAEKKKRRQEEIKQGEERVIKISKTLSE